MAVWKAEVKDLEKVLNGKVALITGASRGIGKHIALEMGKAGALLALNYKEDEKGTVETLRLLKNLGVYVKAYKGDVASFSSSSEIVDSVIKDFGKLDILVNNAGISRTGLFIDMTEQDCNEVMETNFKGVFNCSSAAVKHMINRKEGSIINISSIWGNVGASCEVLYSASKGAVNSFTKALAKELAPSNIRVNAIAPGVIDTDMNNNLTVSEKKELCNEIPMLRFGKSEEIGKAAVFLASEMSNYITGQVITIDGGFC